MEDKSQSQSQSNGASSTDWRAMKQKYANLPAANGALRGITLIVGLALFVLMFVYAATMIHSLFSVRLGAPGFEAFLAVAASVGVVFGVMMIALMSDKHNVRGLAGLYLFVWLILALCLVSLEAAARGGLLAVPESFASIGRVIAAVLAAIALVPAITIPLVARQTDAYASSAAAIGSYVGFVAKGVAIAASVFASAYFGLSRGMPVEVAVLCGFLLESCFLWSYFSLIRAFQNRDVFDMVMWAMATALYGCFIALVSIETISTLAHIEVPLLRPFADAGATLFASAVGLAIILTITVHILTSVINAPWRRAKAGDRVIDGNTRPLSQRLGRGIIGARMGLGALGSAFHDKPDEWLKMYPERAPAQLPQEQPVMAKDARNHNFTITYPPEQAAADRAEADRLRAEDAARQAEYDAAMEAEALRQYLESRREYYEQHGNSAGSGAESAGNTGAQGKNFLA